MKSVHLLPGRSQLHHLVSDQDDIGKTNLIQALRHSHRVWSHNCPLSPALLTLEVMKFRYLYLAAAIAFLVAAVIEFRAPRNLTAALLDAAAGIIFLFLGAGPQRTKS
jgi:hypothetical protein